MSARVEFEGLEELRAALRSMPATLTGEASFIVEGTANEAARRIVDLYPTKTGNLKDGVRVSKARSVSGPFGVAAVVTSSSPHAWLYDNGSQARHTATGANRGRMPERPKHVFVGTAIEYRRGMYAKLADMLKRNGFEVSGG